MPPKQSKPRQKKASKQKAKGRSTQTAPAVPQLPNRKNAPEVKPDNSIQLELQPNAPSTPLHAQSYAVLHQAREEARKDKEWQYSWAKTRQQMEDDIKDRTDGKILRYYQGDVGEAFALGLDSVLIAPTGAGKTMAFAAALAADETKTSKILIISTLNELERDHAASFNKMGYKALVVNGETWNDSLKQELQSLDFRVVLTSPEMVFSHPEFSKLIRDAKWTKDFLGCIVDEAHCVSEWGESFRTSFLEIEKARAFMTSKPIMLASATLPPNMLQSVMSILSFSRRKSFVLNLGNDRPNITPIVPTVSPLAEHERKLIAVEKRGSRVLDRFVPGCCG